MSDNALLDMQSVSQRASSWRFDLLDPGNNVVEPNLAVERDTPPTLGVDVSRASKKTLQGVQFIPGVLEEIDVIKNRMSVTMLLHDGTEWPQGVFLFSDVSAIVVSSMDDTEIRVPVLNLVDQLLIVDQQLETAVAYGPGKRITDAITELLSELPIAFVVDASGAVISATQEAVAWPAGTSRLRVINELAAMIGYHELFFDNFGVAQLHLMPNPETATVDQIIDYPAGGRTYLGLTTRSTNLLALPNRFVVVNNGATQAAVSGVYDVPASAPHSAANRGYVRSQVELMQGLNTNTDAVTAARALARNWKYPYETVEFSGPPDPRHDHYDVVNYEGVRYLELAWSMSCRDGAAMRHSIRRTYEAEPGEVLAS